MFKAEERENLTPLPKEDYSIIDFANANVMPNCHISYQENYYSVPHVYIGEKVDILVSDSLVRIYCRNKEIALHHLIRDEKGKHQTNENHYPDKKNITPDEIKSRYRDEMAKIGEHALVFFDAFVENCSNKHYYRSISGIISLRKKFDDETINKACHRAHNYGVFKYKTVKNICEKGLAFFPVNTDSAYVNTDETSLSRPLMAYTKLLRGGDKNG